MKIVKNKELIRLIEGKSVNFFTPPSSTISSTEEQEKIIELILQDYSDLKGHVYKKWMDFANFVIDNSIFIADHFQK